jgi:hypothetical protein
MPLVVCLQVSGLPNATTCNPSSGSYCHGLDASSLIFLSRRTSRVATMSQDELTAVGPTYTCQSLTSESDLSGLSGSLQQKVSF